ncbi:TPA: DNA-binding response regulator [Bacillus toyonensis]|nr:DNA-binding response regulator [Bacillus toyonensis]
MLSKMYHSIVHGILQTLRISNAMQKLGVKGRSQAVVELLRMGELEL